VLSLLASWLELHFLLNPEPNEYFFGDFGMTDNITINDSAGYYLCKIIKDKDFIRIVIGQLGSHSNRKFGGPVAYVVTDASGITNQWVLDYVAPSMRSATFCADP